MLDDRLTVLFQIHNSSMIHSRSIIIIDLDFKHGNYVDAEEPDRYMRDSGSNLVVDYIWRLHPYWTMDRLIFI